MKALTSFVAGILALTSMSVAAQTQESGRRLVEPERTEFQPHWYMQVQAGLGYTVGETNKFKELASPAAALNFGYRFNPVFGIRFGASGWQGKGVWVDPRMKYKYNYIQGNADAVLSLTNLFCGFNPERTLDFYAFLGLGGAYGFNNDDAEAINAKGYKMEKLWTGHRWFLAGRGGLGVNIKLSPIVALNIEANANMMPDHFNSKHGRDDNRDWQFNGLVGLTIKFGKGTKTIPAVYEDIPAPAPAPAPKPEPKPEPKPAPAPAPAPVLEPMQQDIFFLINSSYIRKSEQAKVDAIVEYMKAHPETKVTITGYADKETGTGPYNMQLSKRRSASVATAIEKAGIAADRIITDGKGDTVQPFKIEKENRVAIAIARP